MDLFDIRDQVLAALTALEPVGVDVTSEEPKTDPDGRIRRTVIVSVTTATASQRRAAGGSVNRDGSVNLLIAAPSRDACLWVTQQARDILADLPLGRPHGRLTDASYDGEPIPDTDTAPARWSRTLTFQITTKRS